MNKKREGTETAQAVRDWVFQHTEYDAVYSYMKYTNIGSWSTALANGMKKVKEYPHCRRAGKAEGSSLLIRCSRRSQRMEQFPRSIHWRSPVFRRRKARSLPSERRTWPFVYQASWGKSARRVSAIFSAIQKAKISGLKDNETITRRNA